MDEHLLSAARALGAESTYGPVPVAIHFGREGVTEPDPFFGGEGPERTGCRLCGECLLGCPYGAKNQLTRNYLHLAEKYGAEIRPEHEVTQVRPLPGGGYEVSTRHPRGRGPVTVVRTQRVVLAAGVLGTLDLLFRCRDELGSLPHVSDQLGAHVRTNSEALTAVLAPPGQDLSRGPTITSDFHPDPHTHVTQNRYVGGWHMRLQLGPMVDGMRPGRRALRTLARLAGGPLAQLRVSLARGFERRLTVLTTMQHVDNELALELRRSPLRPWRRVLRSRVTHGQRAPSHLPVANKVTAAFAEASGGRPLNLLGETLGGLSVTAHVLGGAVMGRTAAEGVVDADHEVFGHPGALRRGRQRDPREPGREPVADDHRAGRAVRRRLPRPQAPRPAEARADHGPPGHSHPADGGIVNILSLRREWSTLMAPPPA